MQPAHTHGRGRPTTMTLGPLNGRTVLFVCEKLAARSGGAERVLIELANELCSRGYQVDIVSHEARGTPPFYPLEPGVLHTNLFPPSSGRSFRAGTKVAAKSILQPRGDLPFPLDRAVFSSRYSSFHKRLAEYIDATEPGVVVPFMIPAIVATALATTSTFPRLVASTHNAPVQDFENPSRWDPGAYARQRRLELMSRMDSIAVLLPEYRDWYPDHLRARTVAVPNAVEPVPADKLAGAQRERTILAVGRLAATKRHDLTLRAFAQLASEFPSWNLRIFGVGPLESELDGLRTRLGLGDRVRLPGHTSDIAGEYLSASILSHPATFEGFPLAVTESLASGLPVVGFADCSGLNSLVVDGVNGILMEAGDGSDQARLAALVDTLRRLMGNQDHRETLGSRGPDSVAGYRPDRVADRWEQVLFPSLVTRPALDEGPVDGLFRPGMVMGGPPNVRPSDGAGPRSAGSRRHESRRRRTLV